EYPGRKTWTLPTAHTSEAERATTPLSNPLDPGVGLGITRHTHPGVERPEGRDAVVVGVDDPVQAKPSTSMYAHHRRVRTPPLDGIRAEWVPDLHKIAKRAVANSHVGIYIGANRV